MAKLSEDVKRFIVERLACYDTPSEIADAVKDEFKVTIARQQVYEYDPEKAGRKPALKWCDLHAAVRKKFLEAVDLPITKQSYRLQQLQRMEREARKRKNYPLAAALLKQAAEERGGMYRNRRTIKHRGDKDAPFNVVFMPEVPPPVGATKRAAEDDGE